MIKPAAYPPLTLLADRGDGIKRFRCLCTFPAIELHDHPELPSLERGGCTEIKVFPVNGPNLTAIDRPIGSELFEIECHYGKSEFRYSPPQPEYAI